jgi:probable rRNA maturation factor
MIEVEVEDLNWTRVLPTATEVAREAASLAAREAAEESMIAILLTDDKTLLDLNRRFRGQDRPTNVLAFPALARTSSGDLALAFGVCAREAHDQGKPLGDHLRHLVIHGVLHLLGHDHQTSDDAAIMEAVEIDLLGRLGVASPYLGPIDPEDHVQQE